MNCFLKQGLLEYPIIFYVRTYPCTMRGLQALIGFLDMEGLPRWGGPHEEEVTVIRVVIHKGIIWPEFSIGECPSDLGDDTWLGIDNIINQGHGTRSGFQGITYWYPWVFGFTSSIDYCGTSQINSPQGGGGFLILMRVWGIITLLVILMRYLNVKYLSLWYQTKISISSYPKRYLADHNFDMSPLVILAPTISVYNSSNF